MKKYFLIIFILIIGQTSIIAQIIDSNRFVQTVKPELNKLSLKIDNLNQSVINLERNNINNTSEIESLKKQLMDAKQKISNVSDSLNYTKKIIFDDSYNTHKKIEVVSSSFSTKISILVLAVLSGLIITFGLFVFFKKRLNQNNNHLIDQIGKTRNSLENETIKLDSKLVEILKNQLSLSKQERTMETEKTNSNDHKLPLKVGEEIHRMRKRIENMPSDIKGLSALNNSLQRLEEEFIENGYEIEKLEGKKYVDGMKVEARFVDNPDIPKGEEIITDVIRPAIKYNGVLIQVAKVEVSKS
jgi:peptidoglycan hydrolase CwlO-like protein